MSRFSDSDTKCRVWVAKGRDLGHWLCEGYTRQSAHPTVVGQHGRRETTAAVNEAGRSS